MNGYKPWIRGLSLSALMALTLFSCKGANAPKIDAEIMNDLKAMVANCEVDVKRGLVRKCHANEDDQLENKFRKHSKEAPGKELIPSLDTFSAALSSEDPKLVTAAANVLLHSFRSFGKDVKPDAISAPVAQRLIAAVGKLSKPQNFMAMRATVNAAMLAGQQDALYAMLDGSKNKQLQQEAYPYLMYYGGMAAFPKIQELGKSSDPELVAAALKAPRSLSHAPAAEDKTKICSWGQGFLKDEHKNVFTNAGKLMIACGGASVDALLAEGERREAENKFSRSDYLVFRDVCFSPYKTEIKDPSRLKQCDRNFALLEKVVNNDKIASRARGLALFAIYYQRRDQKTLDLMKKYENNQDKMVSRYAKDAIKSLEMTYKLGNKVHQPQKRKLHLHKPHGGNSD